MVNSATAKEFGGDGRSVWTRLNDLPPNQVYDPNQPPKLIAEERSGLIDQMMFDAVNEMFALWGP